MALYPLLFALGVAIVASEIVLLAHRSRHAMTLLLALLAIGSAVGAIAVNLP